MTKLYDVPECRIKVLQQEGNVFLVIDIFRMQLKKDRSKLFLQSTAHDVIELDDLCCDVPELFEVGNEAGHLYCKYKVIRTSLIPSLEDFSFWNPVMCYVEFYSVEVTAIVLEPLFLWYIFREETTLPMPVGKSRTTYEPLFHGWRFSKAIP